MKKKGIKLDEYVNSDTGVLNEFKKIDRKMGKVALAAIIPFFYFIYNINCWASGDCKLIFPNTSVYLNASIGLLTFITIFFFLLEEKSLGILLGKKFKEIMKLHKIAETNWKNASKTQRIKLYYRGQYPKNIKGQYGFINFHWHFYKATTSFILAISTIVLFNPERWLSLVYIYLFWMGVGETFYLIYSWYYFYIENAKTKFLKQSVNF